MTDNQITKRLAEWMFPPCPNGTANDRIRRVTSAGRVGP